MREIRTEAAEEEGRDESLSRLRDDMVVKVLPTGESFIIWHRQGLVDRIGGRSLVPWVNRNAGAEPTVAV